jgi:hypothetical protein
MPISPVLSGTTIVVVEDYPNLLFGIAHFLTRHGAKVFPVRDAFEGMQVVREHRPNSMAEGAGLLSQCANEHFHCQAVTTCEMSVALERHFPWPLSCLRALFLVRLITR